MEPLYLTMYAILFNVRSYEEWETKGKSWVIAFVFKCITCSTCTITIQLSNPELTSVGAWVCCTFTMYTSLQCTVRKLYCARRLIDELDLAAYKARVKFGSSVPRRFSSGAQKALVPTDLLRQTHSDSMRPPSPSPPPEFARSRPNHVHLSLTFRFVPFRFESNRFDFLRDIKACAMLRCNVYFSFLFAVRV